MIDDGAFNFAKESFSSSVTSQPRSQGSFLSPAGGTSESEGIEALGTTLKTNCFALDD